MKRNCFVTDFANVGAILSQGTATLVDYLLLAIFKRRFYLKLQVNKNSFPQ